jgi:hypothetical protein
MEGRRGAKGIGFESLFISHFDFVYCLLCVLPFGSWQLVYGFEISPSLS